MTRSVGRTEVYQREDGKYAWRLIVDHAGDSDVVASDAGQGFSRKIDAETSAQMVLHGNYSPVRRDFPEIGMRDD